MHEESYTKSPFIVIRPYLYLFLLIIGLTTCKNQPEGNALDDKGRKQGTWKTYYPDGKLESVANYYNDFRKGTEKIYYPDGALRETVDWKTDSISEYIDGYVRHYYGNGNLKFEEYYDEGIPKDTVSQFYEGGLLKMQGSWLEGLRNGVWYYFRQDGSIKYTIDFDGGYESPYYENYLSGVIEYYASDGTKYKREIWNGGHKLTDQVIVDSLAQKMRDIVPDPL